MRGFSMPRQLLVIALPFVVMGCSSKVEVQPGLWRLTEQATGVESTDKDNPIPPELAAGSNSKQSVAICWGPKDTGSFRGMMKDAGELPKDCKITKDVVADGKIDFELECKDPSAEGMSLVRKMHGTYTATTFEVESATTMSGPTPDGKTTSMTFKAKGTAERVGECKA